MQQIINGWCNLIAIDPATVQMASGLFGSAGAYLAFAAGVAVCGVLVSAYLRTTI